MFIRIVETFVIVGLGCTVLLWTEIIIPALTQ